MRECTVRSEQLFGRAELSFQPRVGGPRTLEELASLFAVMEAASIVTDVYSQRLRRDVLH